MFLIKSFSVEGDIVTPSGDLELPISTSDKKARQVCSIEITRNAVASEGTIIAPLETVAGADSLLVPTLFEWMRLEKAKSEDTAKANEVLIQSDREIEFDVVKRVMYTCSKAGFTDFSVLVLQED